METLHAVGLVGTAAAVIVIVGWTWMWPDDFDWYTQCAAGCLALWLHVHHE